jgi:hypothetical protein
MILEKEINGLFSLCMLVATKTAAFVTFEMASHTKGCYINIIDDGYDQDVEADGSYTIYFSSELYEESSRKVYEAATEHLLRLLEGKSNEKA